VEDDGRASRECVVTAKVMIDGPPVSSSAGTIDVVDGDAAAQAQLVYDQINARTSACDDFDETQLEGSRQYFDLASPRLRTRSFDVLTCLVGLQIPSALQSALGSRVDEILSILPQSARVYRVNLPLLHWESHIVRRPGEPEPPFPLDQVADCFAVAVSDSRSFQIAYRGFFVAPDGTIAFQGYGTTDQLRSHLSEAMPFSSLHQNKTAHISVARILDPIGPDAFHRLLAMRSASDHDDVLGVLPVREVKLVSERRWYMEDYTILRTAELAAGRDRR